MQTPGSHSQRSWLRSMGGDEEPPFLVSTPSGFWVRWSSSHMGKAQLLRITTKFPLSHSPLLHYYGFNVPPKIDVLKTQSPMQSCCILISLFQCLLHNLENCRSWNDGMNAWMDGQMDGKKEGRENGNWDKLKVTKHFLGLCHFTLFSHPYPASH